ncbi:hypothetical protein DSM106972_098180 [Dulcicalothrix desertica PCC 7102]|uniref:Uncharacterized protein n=1 Tax=Dulcicalothrix desertica PCC 7102 TaxID=232991 RepID=A0A3S5K2N9_9CYAN|nr:DUF5110 domain-containing protein [Dulcicalothrix desertica]RUS92768.1 hypothetical protein DSM106972_098180 [Dulcicalothrix desertica PCC 7102]
MQEDRQLILHIYPTLENTENLSLTPTSSFCIYSDAGDGYGKWRLDKFQMQQNKNSLEVIWEEEGDYDFAYTSVVVQVHRIQLQQAWVDEKEVITEGQKFECAKFSKIRVSN